ncbi:hypothetical protein CNR22_17605 [Sphingobacteriaceae bacterium]|nr:hypothetical protein CNR22_17605 [Sphingobacteriaceae bacterium]
MKKILLTILCFAILISCKKEDKTEPETPTITTGTVTGKITHYDQFGTKYTSGLNTATVSLEGTNFTGITDTSGIYKLTNVPSGTYTLAVKKPGCGLIKTENIHYNFEDTTTYNASVSDIPAFTLSAAYAKDTTWFNGSVGGIFYNASPASLNKNANIVAIIGKSSKIDLANPDSYENYALASIADSTDYGRFFSYQLLKYTYTFKKDSAVYMKIYPVSAKGARYKSDRLNAFVYTSFGTPYPTIFMLNVK